MIYLASVMGSILSNILLVWKNYTHTHGSIPATVPNDVHIIWQCTHHMIMLGTRLLLLVGWCWPSWSTIQYDRFVCNKGALPLIYSPLCVLHVILTFHYQLHKHPLRFWPSPLCHCLYLLLLLALLLRLQRILRLVCSIYPMVLLLSC